MCSRPVGQAPATYPSQSQTTPAPPGTKIYRNQHEYMAEQEEIAASSKLRSVHQKNIENRGVSPDSGHGRTEQRQNLRKQSLLKELQSIEYKIGKLQKEMKRHEKTTPSLLSSDVENQLIECKRRQQAIRAELNAVGGKSKTAANDGGKSTSSEVSTTSSSGTDSDDDDNSGSTSSEVSTTSSSSFSSSPSDSDDGSVSSTLPRGKRDGVQHGSADGQDMHAASSASSSPDVMAAAKMLLADMERSLLDLSSNDDKLSKAKAEEIKNQREAIKSLRDMLNQYLSPTSAPSAEEEKAVRTRPMTSLARTKTGQRPGQTTKTATTPGPSNHPDGHPNDKVTKADLAQIHESSNRLPLCMPEDQRQRFDTKDAQKIADLEKEIDRLATEADAAFQGYARLRKAIDRDLRNGNVPEKTLEAKQRKCDKYRQESMQCSVELAALIEEWESYAELVDPGRLKSAKQRADERKALVEKFKSDETRELEKVHAEMLAELREDIKKNPGSNIFWDAVAGVAGFSASFLIGNTIARTAFPGAPWVGAALSATLHVITATPVVKQLMARTWSANSLAELNNYFKLLGNRWGDARHGQTDVRKYDSRDPNLTHKLTIDERMAENKDFAELLGNRYRDEESGYWSYTANYSIKAAMMAYMVNWMSQDKLEVKVIETVWHGIMGMTSGAEYVMFQQHARSTQPGATMTPVPTRDIFAAQAASLNSLYVDLSRATRQDPDNPDSHLDQATLHALDKECARIAKELAAAEAKARVAGIARYEFLEQFKGDAKWDTLSEVLGRFVTLIPTSLVGHFTAAWRKSPDPLLMFLGNFLPAVALMFPVPLPIPGFTGRPLVCGVIRAGIQMFLSGRSAPTVTTRIPPEVRDAPEHAANRSTTQDKMDETSDRVGDDSDNTSSSSSSVSDKKPAEPVLEEVIVDTTDSTSDEDRWTGNPTERDRNAAN